MSLRHLPRNTLRHIRRSLGLITPKPYWESRRDAKYLAEVRRVVAEVGADARTILDVGSNGCPYLDWFGWIPTKASVDLRRPYDGPGVEAITSDFLAWTPPQRYDIVLCLQVLEHVQDAPVFARRLMAATRGHLIVSVPYQWPAGRCAEHVHDPVDEAKLLEWFGREPVYSRIVAENSRTARMVCRY